MTMTRTSTWNNIGTTINTNDFSKVLSSVGLDYTVESKPVFTNFNNKNIEIPNRKAIVRDDGHVYQVLSKNYTPIQNAEAFDFINYIDEDIHFVKAGETQSGLIYIIGELPEVNILGDKFIPHVIFQNSHNGKYPLATSICPLRIVCQNQFKIAFKQSNSTFVIRHTKNIASKMKMASETLENVSSYMKIFNEKAEMFSKKNVSESQITKFINFLFPITEDMSDKLIASVEEEKMKFIKAYKSEDNLNFKGSAWGLINGLTDYITHKDYKRKVEYKDEKKFVETILISNVVNNSVKYLESSLV